MIPMLLASLLSIAMIAVIVTDARHYLIPNKLNLAIACGYLPFLFLAPEAINWPMGFAVGAGMLLLCAGLFYLRVFGGGDAKLLAALALYTGWSSATAGLLIYTALLGGILAAITVIARTIAKKKQPNTNQLPIFLQPNAPLPYGVAIAIAFMWLLWSGQIPGLTAIL